VIGIGSHGSALEITRRTRWAGESRAAKVLALMFFGGMLILMFAPWQQNAVGTGEVIAFSPNERALSVQAPIEGRVVRWHYQEGDHVEAGEIIVDLADNDPKAVERYETERAAVARQVNAAQASIDALTEQLDSLVEVRRLTLESASAQVRMAQNKAKAAELKLEAAEAKQTAADLQLSRIDTLAEDGLNSRRDFELARRDAAEARAATMEARANREAARSEVAAKRAERESKASDITAKIASVRDKLESARSKRAKSEETLAKVERALARQNSLSVRAPRSGMLMRVRAREGSAFVKKTDELAVVIPQTDRRAVELFVDGIDAPLVVPGQNVRLQFEGWPAIQFGGWPKAAVGTFLGRVSFVDAQANDQGRFRVLVSPEHDGDWPSGDVLRQGNLVNGWILLNEVSVGYELWRQLNGFPADLPPEAARASGIGGVEARKPKAEE
jgi:multidrug efflux pump subunit AcrA (membrane-fusion protein)